MTPKILKRFRTGPRKARLYGITHFLRIPFTTRRSTPQLVSSIKHVARDPIASALPYIAWKTPEELHYPVGLLSLTTPSHIKAAIQLLKALNADYQPDCAVQSGPPPLKHTIRPLSAEGAVIRSSYAVQSGIYSGESRMMASDMASPVAHDDTWHAEAFIDDASRKNS